MSNETNSPISELPDELKGALLGMAVIDQVLPLFQRIRSVFGSELAATSERLIANEAEDRTGASVGRIGLALQGVLDALDAGNDVAKSIRAEEAR